MQMQFWSQFEIKNKIDEKIKAAKKRQKWRIPAYYKHVERPLSFDKDQMINYNRVNQPLGQGGNSHILKTKYSKTFKNPWADNAFEFIHFCSPARDKFTQIDYAVNTKETEGTETNKKYS